MSASKPIVQGIELPGGITMPSPQAEVILSGTWNSWSSVAVVAQELYASKLSKYLPTFTGSFYSWHELLAAMATLLPVAELVHLNLVWVSL